MIKKLVTIHGVKVDSVCSTIWEANKGGIKDIVPGDHGVHIMWNLGKTFVPWSNVRYTEETTDRCFICDGTDDKHFLNCTVWAIRGGNNA